MRTIVADITKAIPGTEGRLLDLLSNRFSGEGDHIVIVCKEHQKAVASTRAGTEVRVLPTFAHYSQVANFIQREFLDGALSKSEAPDTTVTLVSFHPAVLSLRDYLATSMKARVDSVPWGTLMRSNTARPSAGSL
jgi:hypothetical protein